MALEIAGMYVIIIFELFRPASILWLNCNEMQSNSEFSLLLKQLEVFLAISISHC